MRIYIPCKCRVRQCAIRLTGLIALSHIYLHSYSTWRYTNAYTKYVCVSGLYIYRERTHCSVYVYINLHRLKTRWVYIYSVWLYRLIKLKNIYPESWSEGTLTNRAVTWFLFTSSPKQKNKKQKTKISLTGFLTSCQAVTSGSRSQKAEIWRSNLNGGQTKVTET